MGGGIFRDDISESFDVFLTENEKKNKKQIAKLENDIISCYFKYGATPDEYFGFGFRYYNSKRRSEFLTNQHKDKMMIKKVGKEESWDILEDKSLFYSCFKQFFNRDVCIIRNEEDKFNFLSFVHRCNNFIIKPIDGQSGKDIEIKKTDGSNKEALLVFDYLDLERSWIVEELIVQNKKMSDWNSSSVNTIRLPTFLNSQGFHVLKPFIRVGRKGFIVDNASKGGLVSVIDEKSGLLLTDGNDRKTGISYQNHPDSKINFKNWQVPKWSDLLALAEKIHRTLPYYPYIAWDFALTDKGWVLIEGNWGRFTSEFVDKEGIKEKFNSLFD